jgi:putative ABC transport system permease protein
MSEPSNRHAINPRWTTEVRTRLSGLRLSPAREAEIVHELSQHLEEHFQELIAGGASRDDAERLTLAEFSEGNRLARYMAPLRQAHTPTPVIVAAPTGHMLGDLWQDVRHAGRVFVKQRAFALTTVLTLALGIGATTAIFSVVYGVLLRPLPFAEPERLVSISQIAPHVAGANQGPVTFNTYTDHQTVFEAIGAWDAAEVSITGSGDPERVPALLVSSSTLQILRVQPALGRFFGRDDDVPAAGDGDVPRSTQRVILTHGYWQRRFGGATDVVGRPLVIDGRPATVIGVLPSSFTFLRTKPSVLLPHPVDPAARRGFSFGFQALARLKPGVTLTQANRDAARVLSLLPPEFARFELKPNIRPLAADVIGNIGDTLWLLMGAVGVVLLIACGNVANLFLVRAEARQQELAMRAALGASRARLSRALLSESLVLALAGGALGLIVAAASLGLLRWMAPAYLPRLDEIAIDPTVLFFTLIVSMLSGSAFGAFAMRRFGRPNIAALKEGGRSVSDSPARHRTRHALVVAQVGLSLTLLIVSGLMIRTFIAMRQIDPGFKDPAQVQTFVVAVPATFISDPDQAARTHQNVAERIAQVPGVTSVGMASSITMDGENNGNYLMVEDFPDPDGVAMKLRRFKSLTPGYVEAMGNRVVAGRDLTWSDIYQQRMVIVISETLAREYWREPALAIGKRVRCCNAKTPWREIIGVTGDEHDDGLNRPATAIVYFPMLNESYRWRTMAYAVRSARVGTPAFMREIERAVWSVNADLPLAKIQTLEEIQSASMDQTSFALVMLAIAATVALSIGIVGIYGVIAYAAAQRTREIGVRMALGAQVADVRGLFLRQGLWLTGTGIALGIAASIAVTRVMSAMLFGVSATDPITYVAVSAVLTVIALAATYLPARRAARVDPVVALRAEA